MYLLAKPEEETVCSGARCCLWYVNLGNSKILWGFPINFIIWWLLKTYFICICSNEINIKRFVLQKLHSNDSLFPEKKKVAIKRLGQLGQVGCCHKCPYNYECNLHVWIDYLSVLNKNNLAVIKDYKPRAYHTTQLLKSISFHEKRKVITLINLSYNKVSI